LLLPLVVLLAPGVALADWDDNPYGDDVPICEPTGAPLVVGDPLLEPTDAEIVERLSGIDEDIDDLADYVSFHRGNVAMRAGRLDDACGLFHAASESILPALALRARYAGARCLVEKGASREATNAVRQLMTRYPGLEAAQLLYRDLYPTRPAPEHPFDEHGRKRSASASAKAPAPAAPRWRPPGPGEIADRMVGHSNPRMHPVMRRLSAANLYMKAGRYADAWRFFNAVPARVLGRDGTIQAGLAALSAGETEAALRVLRPLAASNDDRSIYYAARAEQLANNVDAARQGYERIARDEPPGYYGVWAAARLRELDGEINTELLTPVWLDGVPTCAAPTLPSREDALADLDSLIAEHGQSLPWLKRVSPAPWATRGLRSASSGRAGATCAPTTARRGVTSS
jgi:tetratricopeptide (TPR) repeat protein